jgi:hypothetical protein
MGRLEQLRSASNERHRLPNDMWIIENADALFRFASTKFRIYGKGAILMDRNNVLRPPRYVSSEEIKKGNLSHLTSFIDRYDPNNSFVISLDINNKKRHIYRIDIQKITPL